MRASARPGPTTKELAPGTAPVLVTREVEEKEEEKEESGEIVTWSHKKRYGFIKPTCGGDDIWFHVEDVHALSDAPQYGWESKHGIV